jgi:hypothetical protein
MKIFCKIYRYADYLFSSRTNKSFDSLLVHIAQVTQVKYLFVIIVLCVNFTSEVRNILLKKFNTEIIHSGSLNLNAK